MEIKKRVLAQPTRFQFWRGNHLTTITPQKSHDEGSGKTERPTKKTSTGRSKQFLHVLIWPALATNAIPREGSRARERERERAARERERERDREREREGENLYIYIYEQSKTKHIFGSNKTGTETVKTHTRSKQNKTRHAH